MDEHQQRFTTTVVPLNDPVTYRAIIAIVDNCCLLYNSFLHSHSTAHSSCCLAHPETDKKIEPLLHELIQHGTRHTQPIPTTMHHKEQEPDPIAMQVT